LAGFSLIVACALKKPRDTLDNRSGNLSVGHCDVCFIALFLETVKEEDLVTGD